MTEQNKEEMICISKSKLEEYIHSSYLACDQGLICPMPYIAECDDSCENCKYRNSIIANDGELIENVVNWLKEEENA